MREITERQRRDLKQRVMAAKHSPTRLKPWAGKLCVEIVSIDASRCDAPPDQYPNLKVVFRKLGTASVRRVTLWTNWHSTDDSTRKKEITRYLFLSLRLHIVTIEQKHKNLLPKEFSAYLKKLLVGAQLDAWFEPREDSNFYDLSNGRRREVFKGDLYLRELRALGSYGNSDVKYAKVDIWMAKDKDFRRKAQEQAEIDAQLQEEADGGHIAEPQIDSPLPAVEVELPEFEDDIEEGGVRT